MAALIARVSALLAALATALGACAQPVAIRVVDDAGEAIELAGPARRIVSLAPHATELLFAAGALDRVVGVVAGSDFPDAARRLAVVGDAQSIDLERIVALKPDLVVTWPYTAPAQVAKLKAQGVTVFTTDPPTIDGVAADVATLGRLAGTAGTAERAAASLRARVAALREVAAGKTALRVFYQIWGAPIFTVGGKHLITQAIEACGGRNVFAALRLPAPQVSIEAVLAAQPEVIVAGADGAKRPPWLDTWRRWPDLPAVRLRNLEVVDADLLHRPGPRFVDGVESLCAALERSRGRR